MKGFDFSIRFNNNSHQMTFGGLRRLIAARFGGFVMVCVFVSNSMCNMLPLTKLFWGDERANVAANIGNSPNHQPLDSVVNSGLVLHVALELMHNKNECWLLVVKRPFPCPNSRAGEGDMLSVLIMPFAGMSDFFGWHLDKKKKWKYNFCKRCFSLVLSTWYFGCFII